MSATRLQKMNKLLKEELSRIIREDMNDPRLGMVSITDIVLSFDLKQAKVYISAYGTTEERKSSILALTSASRFLRGEVARQLELRHTPELKFLFDDSLERGARIFDLLNQVKEQEKVKEKGSEEE